MSKGDLKERLKWMFNLYDQNQNGFIDLNELHTAIRVRTFKKKNLCKY